MEIDAWVHFFGQVDPKTQNAVVGSLTCAGIKTRTLVPDVSNGSGVVFFGELNHGLCTFLREVSSNGRDRVLAISISPSSLDNGSAWCLLEAGASDVLNWHALTSPAAQVAARLERWNVVDQIVSSPVVENNLIGKSAAWKSILRQVVEIARFTDASVLITGESGTGKDLAARLIHTLDPRRQKRELVVLDCTTIVPELSGSEFFGHERGAFTGAVAARDGAFALADGGTLFLDEVGELPAGLQAQLLRVVQEHTYKRVGSNQWQHTNFRLVCATNKNLYQAVVGGEFRHDLYYRMANWVCQLSPLRERSEDILLLTQYFLRELQHGREPSELDIPVRGFLLGRDYPGNVRELKQLVSRISYRHVGEGPITVGDIPEDERPLGGEYVSRDWRDAHFEQSVRHALDLGIGLKELKQATTEMAIRIAVNAEDGNLQRAAHKLGVTDRALQMRRANGH